MEKRVLLGISDPSVLQGYSRLSKACGYEVIVAQSVDAFTEKLHSTEFGIVVMDANLGNPRSLDLTPAEHAYAQLRTKIALGEVKFAAVSGHDETVELLQRKGIPSRNKTEGINDLFD